MIDRPSWVTELAVALIILYAMALLWVDRTVLLLRALHGS